MRVLVLGGGGFIGSHLVEALVAAGSHVLVLTRPGRQSVQLQQGVDYRFADFADSVSLAEALVDVDLVIHLISTTVPSTANLDPVADINGNLLSTVRLLQLMRDQGVSRLVFLSSGGTVYGDTKITPIPEDHERNPVSSYGIVKVAIENFITMFSSQYGLQPLVLRVSNPYGPRQRHLGVQGVIPTFFHRIVAGEEIRIWGDGTSVRDYLYITDLVSFITQAVREGLSGTYNVGSGQGTSLQEVLSLIQEISGIAANAKYLAPRDFDVNKVVLNISKACNAIDWKPLVSLREGCERYWKWMNV